jgi:hypothetical protein
MHGELVQFAFIISLSHRRVVCLYCTTGVLQHFNSFVFGDKAPIMSTTGRAPTEGNTPVVNVAVSATSAVPLTTTTASTVTAVVPL